MCMSAFALDYVYSALCGIRTFTSVQDLNTSPTTVFVAVQDVLSFISAFTALINIYNLQAELFLYERLTRSIISLLFGCFCTRHSIKRSYLPYLFILFCIVVLFSHFNLLTLFQGTFCERQYVYLLLLSLNTP